MKIKPLIIGAMLLMPLAAIAAAERQGDETSAADGGASNEGAAIMNNGTKDKTGKSSYSYSYSSSSVSVINDDVFIDGEQVPRDVTRYTSKTGTVYRIERSGNGVSVTTE